MELVFEDSVKSAFQGVLEQVKKLVLESRLGFKKAVTLKFSSSKERAAFEHLMTYLLKLETISPGSAEIFLQDSYKFTVQSRSLSKDLLDSLLLTYADRTIVDLVKDALEIAGLDGKIVLEKERSGVDLLELTKGCFFPNVASPMLTNSAFVNAKVIPIDGYVESVTEINRILEEAASSKETVLLLVRGISEEVLHTLKVNYDRKTLTVVPIVVKYDIDGANLLNDIAITSGSDMVSSLKGQLISSVTLGDFSRVDRVDITTSSLLVENSKSSRSVDSHIAFLQRKLLDSENEESKLAIEKRIKNLGSKRVVIKLREGVDWADRSFLIDRCLRAVKLATSHGVVELANKLYPLASFHAALKYRENFEKQIKEISCLITD